ncbi:hypothetical protein [Streptomyces sp. CA-179760]|uniref:hypothetical protein n=1 Tax=Streptomyces sp. CA-179760 TaxID=3240054 RepID=UPI003D8A3981
MLDPIVRTLAWMLSRCTPRPRGRHRLGAVPPLRVTGTPPPPPRFTEQLDDNACHAVRAWALDPTEDRRQRERRRAARLATYGIDVGTKHIHGARVPAATR